MKCFGLMSTAPAPILSLSRTSWNRINLKISPWLYLSPPKSSSSAHGGGIMSRASMSVLEDESINNFRVNVGSPISPHSTNPLAKLSLSDQAFLLLAFIACTASVAFTSFVIAAIPTLVAMGRAASSFAKLADTARQELPSTLAAIRLSGMEISDLTLELSDLSQEITDGVNKSAKAVQAAEAGIRHIGTLAHQQTLSMIEERASLPEISLKPAVASAAEKTSHAIGRATRKLVNIITGGDKDDEDSSDV